MTWVVGTRGRGAKAEACGHAECGCEAAARAVVSAESACCLECPLDNCVYETVLVSGQRPVNVVRDAEMRELRRENVPTSSIAEMYGISQRRVFSITQGMTV